MSDFRNSNKKLNHKTYSITNINKILMKLEGFKYVMLLDFSISYYHNQLSENGSRVTDFVCGLSNYLLVLKFIYI